MLGAFIFLLLFQLVGEVTVRLLNLPLPGPVVGMLGLFVVLVIRGGVPENLQTTSNALLQYLMLLLVPATTGVMMYFNRLAEEWLAIVLAGVGGAAPGLLRHGHRRSLGAPERSARRRHDLPRDGRHHSAAPARHVRPKT